MGRLSGAEDGSEFRLDFAREYGGTMLDDVDCGDGAIATWRHYHDMGRRKRGHAVHTIEGAKGRAARRNLVRGSSIAMVLLQRDNRCRAGHPALVGIVLRRFGGCELP